MKVPAGWKGHFVSPDVDTELRKSKLFNSRVMAASMEEISTSFTEIELNYPQSYETLPGLPPVNLEN